ncbi:MAG: translocation/assembly module TamB domain-containing protein [Gemmatimonadales bacterium]
MHRWVRRITAGVLLPPAVVLATIAGTAVSLLWTTPGRALSARLATSWLSNSVAGRIHIGSLGGNILNHIVLRDVTIHDSLGGVVLQAPEIEARYLLPELMAGRIVMSDLRLERPMIHLVRLQRGRWNYEEVFRVASGKPSNSAPPLVEFRNVAIHDGDIRVDAPTGPRPPKLPASRNAAPPNQPTILPGSDGLVRVYTATHFTASIPYLRLSNPAHDPILAQINSLAAELGDPKLTLKDLKGEILTAHDSLRFTLEHAELPGTTLHGGGAVRWPRDTILFDFAFDAPRVDLADLHWISPDFPDWKGSGRVVAKSSSGSRTDYTLTHLTLGAGDVSATGRLVAIVDNSRGLGMRDLDLALQNVPVSVMRPYLDTLPVAGTLNGRLLANGFLDGLTLGGDLWFADALVSGTPRSHFVINGLIHFGGAEGAVFEGFRLDESVIALGTVNRLVPSVIIPGDLHLVGHLDGSWQNARFQGTVEHRAPNAGLSRMIGTVRFDTRNTVLGLDLDADFDQLSFNALRSGYPQLAALGGLTGHVVAKGSLESLDLNADLSGEVGHIVARGRVTLMSPRFGADSLVVDLQRADIAAMTGKGTSSALNGRVVVSGTIDSLIPPRGRLTLNLDQSRVGGVTFDAVMAGFRAADGLITVDTATVLWPDGRVDAAGTIGYAAPDSGTLRITGAASSLAAFDSLARATLGVAADTLHPHTFDGLARAALTVRGALDNATVSGTFEAEELLLDSWRVSAMSGTFTADSLGAKGITLNATIDTVSMGARVVDSVHVRVSGRPDSLSLAGNARMHRAHIGGGGAWLARGDVATLQLDSLTLGLPVQQWQLVRPARMTITDRGVTLADTIAMHTVDGSGALTLLGVVPGGAAGDLTASVVGLQLSDVFNLLNAEQSTISGLASLDLHLTGTRDLPLMRGSMGVAGPVIGDVRAPMMRAVFDYEGQKLRSRLSFWRTGDPILEVDVALPLDLALAKRAERKLPGPLEITASADSVDLLVLEAFTPSIKDTRGTIALDMKATGTWAAPRLDGSFAIHEGRMTIPGLGVRYGPIEGTARFSGDSLVVDTLLMSSGQGDIDVKGGIRFVGLTQPNLDLRFNSQGFLVMDVPDYLRLRPTGTFLLRGPIQRPVLTGDGTLSGSVLYFADLVTKRIVDLEDPENLDLVDTTAFRKQSLGAAFQSRFLDSLEIRNLTFQVGSEVWLRSSEANVQLEGQVTVNKLRKQYRLDGEFNAPRGTYTLKIGPVSRDFTIERGTVRYLGTPDLNALLDLQARHVVRTVDGEEIPIVAKIGGSILVPSLSLTSPGRSIAERDLVSYLIFGRSEFQVSGGQSNGVSQAVQTGVALLGTALSNEFQRSLANEFGLDLFEIRPGFLNGGYTGGSNLTQLAIGRQLGAKWFVTATAGGCLGNAKQSFSGRNFGATLEYRFSKTWRAQATAEPLQSCRTSDVFNIQSRYQLGAGLLWQKDY